MKYQLKAEALGLFILFVLTYFHFYPGTWVFFVSLFFVPDVSFALYFFSNKWATMAYNLFHHQGALALLLIIGYLLKEDILMKLALVFLAHSTFDRIAGYGLKYFDSFDHTHLGWIGKSKHLNKE